MTKFLFVQKMNQFNPFYYRSSIYAQEMSCQENGSIAKEKSSQNYLLPGKDHSQAHA